MSRICSAADPVPADFSRPVDVSKPTETANPAIARPVPKDLLVRWGPAGLPVLRAFPVPEVPLVHRGRRGFPEPPDRRAPLDPRGRKGKPDPLVPRDLPVLPAL